MTQYDTVKNIYNAFIVLFFDTSAIVDAILLKKRIMFINSKYIPDRWLELGNPWLKSKILCFDIEENLQDKIPLLDERLRKQTFEYQDYIDKFIQIDGDRSGLDVIIKTLKKDFFTKISNLLKKIVIILDHFLHFFLDEIENQKYFFLLQLMES